jgi:hypothetical protein
VSQYDCRVGGAVIYPVIELFCRSGVFIVQVVDLCHEIPVKLVTKNEENCRDDKHHRKHE